MWKNCISDVRFSSPQHARCTAIALVCAKSHIHPLVCVFVMLVNCNLEHCVRLWLITYDWIEFDSSESYSSTQWPAVAIQYSLITAPPHRCVLENPKNDVRRTDTCQGHRPNGEFLPPIIRVSGRLTNVGTPHSTTKTRINIRRSRLRWLMNRWSVKFTCRFRCRYCEACRLVWIF